MDLRELLTLLAVLLIGVALGGYLVWTLLRARHELELKAQQAVTRKETVKRSGYTLKGRIAEQLAPLLPEFPYDPSDARFLGNPIDYIVFEGYGAVQSRQADDLESVVFVEVKNGRASLSREQRRIRDCIKAGRVRWDEIRIPDPRPELNPGSHQESDISNRQDEALNSSSHQSARFGEPLRD
jgi:hypothetical protein